MKTPKDNTIGNTCEKRELRRKQTDYAWLAVSLPMEKHSVSNVWIYRESGKGSTAKERGMNEHSTDT